MRKLLITGGAGYVGSTLTRAALAAGKEVRVVDSLLHGGDSLLGVWNNPAFEFVRGDIRDASVLKSAFEGGIDAVVHLAAIVGDPACAKSPSEARSVNIDGSEAVYTAAKDSGASRFVFASTCSNYGKMSDPNGYVTETSQLAPISLYAESKVAIERGILADGKPDGFSVACLRLATVFGVSSRMRFDLTINEFTMEMVRNKHLIVFGEQFWRPYIHVADLARAVLSILDAPEDRFRNEVYNIGADELNFTKGTIVERVRERCPDAQVEFVTKQEDPRDYRVSFAKVREAVGFRCARSLDDGIAEVTRLVKSGIIEDPNSPRYRNS